LVFREIEYALRVLIHHGIEAPGLLDNLFANARRFTDEDLAGFHRHYRGMFVQFIQQDLEELVGRGIIQREEEDFFLENNRGMRMEQLANLFQRYNDVIGRVEEEEKEREEKHEDSGTESDDMEEDESEKAGGARPAHEAAERKDNELGSVHADLQEHNIRTLMVREIHRIMRRLLPYGIVTQEELDEIDVDMDLDDLEQMLHNAREMEAHYEPMIRQDERQHAYRQRRGRGMSGGNITPQQMISHMNRMLRDLQTVTVVPNHLLQRLLHMTVLVQNGQIDEVGLRDFYRGFISMYRNFFPAIGGGMSGGMEIDLPYSSSKGYHRYGFGLSDLPSLEPQRRIFPSPKLDIRDTMKPLRF
jgi:hypothetical protein